MSKTSLFIAPIYARYKFINEFDCPVNNDSILSIYRNVNDESTLINTITITPTDNHVNYFIKKKLQEGEQLTITIKIVDTVTNTIVEYNDEFYASFFP